MRARTLTALRDRRNFHSEFGYSIGMQANASYQVIIPAAGSSRRLARLTENQPKALLEIRGRSIIEHSLDILDQRGFRRVTFVVGYMRELFMRTLGDRHGGLLIEYEVSPDYATTEHGWSLYLSKQSWLRECSPVVFMDADNLYDPAMLDRVLGAPFENVVLVDDNFETGAREEELVLGKDGVISGLQRGLARDFVDYAGGFVGINRFSASCMQSLYAYMDSFFEARGRQQKYERVFDNFIKDTGATLNYLGTGGLAWININHEEEYELAQSIAATMAAGNPHPNPHPNPLP